MKLLEKIRDKRRWKWTAYSFFFGVFFYGAVAIGFPYDALRDRVADIVRQQTGKQISIGKVRLAGLSGIRLYDVRLATENDGAPSAAKIAARQVGDSGAEKGSASADDERKMEELRKKISEMGKEGAPEERKKLQAELADLRRKQRSSAKDAAENAPQDSAGDAAKGEPAAPAADGIHLDSITAKVDLLSAIRGRQGFSFDARAWGGRIDGRISMSEDARRITIDARDISLEESPLRALSGLDLEGKLQRFELELTAEGTDYSKAQGHIAIQGDELVLRGGEVQHFELPRIALGTLDGKVEVKDGKAETDVFEIRGPDLEAKLGASVRLSPELASSPLSGKLQIKPSDDWWNRNEMLKTAANFAMPAGSDGWRSVNLSGQLRSPGFRP